MTIYSHHRCQAQLIESDVAFDVASDVVAHFKCSPIRNDMISRPVKFDIIFSLVIILTNLFFKPAVQISGPLYLG
jgi:hypothetical protein